MTGRCATSESPVADRLAALREHLESLPTPLVPQVIADSAAELLDASVLVVAASGSLLEPAAAASSRPRAAAFLEHTLRLTFPATGTAGRVLESAEPLLVPVLERSDLDAEPPGMAQTLLDFGAASILLVALDGTGSDRSTGLLAAFRHSDQPAFDAADLRLGEEIGAAVEGAFAGAVAARVGSARRELAADVYITDLLDALPLEAAVLASTGELRATNRLWDEYATAAEFDGAWSGVGTRYLDLLSASAQRHRGAAVLLEGITGVLRGELPSFTADYDTSGGDVSRTYSMTVLPLGEPGTGAVVTRTDVTLRKALERQLAQRATHDALTGLPNRLLLRERLSHAVVRAARTGSLVAVLFCDLDQFKFVNDTLGHDVGDQVLVAVAERLRAAVRASDSITRFGGDEFVVVAEDLKDADGAHVVAGTLLDCLRNPFKIGDQELYFGVSIGVAVTEGMKGAGDDVANILLREADTAMYEAKRAGRNRAVVFRTELREAAERALRLTTSLRAAVSLGQLGHEYQPQLDCGTGRLCGAEALLHWNHPELGRLDAAAFVTDAEESGVVAELARWQLDAACRRLAEWREHLPDEFSLGVNLTARQVVSPDLPDLVRQALAEWDVPPRRLTLELPESVLSDDPHRTSATLARLHQTGARLAVDGFGTGYSSLSYLQAFPVDELKVDRSFVVVVGENPRASAMVSGISALARALGLRLVAEGVETGAQLDAVRQAGCDGYQQHGVSEDEETFATRLGVGQPAL